MVLRSCIHRATLILRTAGDREATTTRSFADALYRSWRNDDTVRGSISKGCCCRSASSTVEQAQSQIDEVNDLFAEARELIQDATEEAETVYFNEAHQEAKDAVDEVLVKYRTILQDLTDNEQGKLQRAMGLKMEQLKAEIQNLDELHA